MSPTAKSPWVRRDDVHGQTGNGEIAVVGVEFDDAFSYAEDFRGSLLRFASGIPLL